MPKTKRELLNAVFEKIGGEHAERMRAVLKQKSSFDDILDRPMSDEEYAAKLEKSEPVWKAVLSKMKKSDWEKPGSWGLPN